MIYTEIKIKIRGLIFEIKEQYLTEQVADARQLETKLNGDHNKMLLIK